MSNTDPVNYLFFQFTVDNTACIERAAQLLLAQIPAKSSWVLAYLGSTPKHVLQYAVIQEYIQAIIPLPPSAEDLDFLHDLLESTGIVPDRWLLMTACDTRSHEILEVLLEVEGVVVDDWIIAYAASTPSISEQPTNG